MHEIFSHRTCINACVWLLLCVFNRSQATLFRFMNFTSFFHYLLISFGTSYFSIPAWTIVYEWVCEKNLSIIYIIRQKPGLFGVNAFWKLLKTTLMLVLWSTRLVATQSKDIFPQEINLIETIPLYLSDFDAFFTLR